MKTPAIVSLTLPGLVVVMTCLLHPRQDAVGADAPKPAAPASTNAPRIGLKFRPPPTGAPAMRVTGGSRGTGDALVTLDVLAPDQAGLTTQGQPSLFWFQSKPANAKFELTLLQDKKVKPLVQVLVDRASKAGIQRLKLSDHGVTLVPGVEYQWVVALVTDPDNRSTDLVASGVIKRVDAPAELREPLRTTQPSDLAGLYAENGIWYDALAALSDQIEAKPADRTLRDARGELLQQVGLKDAAAFDLAVATR